MKIEIGSIREHINGKNYKIISMHKSIVTAYELDKNGKKIEDKTMKTGFGAISKKQYKRAVFHSDKLKNQNI